MNWAIGCIHILFCCLVVKQITASELTRIKEKDTLVIDMEFAESLESTLKEFSNAVLVAKQIFDATKGMIEEYENSKAIGICTDEEIREGDKYFTKHLENVKEEFDKVVPTLLNTALFFESEEGKMYDIKYYEEFKGYGLELLKNRKEFLEYKAIKDNELQQSCLVPIVGSGTSY